MNKEAAETGSLKSVDHIRISLLIGILTLGLLLATEPDIGVTWDEPTYILASEHYMGWFPELVNRPDHALSDRGIREYWEFNHEHPPLNKVWSGVVWTASRSFLEDLTAHRLGNILISAVLVGMVYLLIGPEVSPLAGIAAAAALISMPRFFLHAHLATLDVPVSAFIFAAVLFYWKTRTYKGLKWAVFLGIIYGAGLATKINALVTVPGILGVWFLLYQRNRNAFLRLSVMGMVGTFLFFATWPWLYRDTWDRLAEYLSFMTATHYEIEQYYFGSLYTPPPWHFLWFIALAVVPIAISVFGGAAVVIGLKRWRRAPIEILLLIGSVLPLFILSTGKSQVFDNDRLIMSIFPFVACLAGIGFFHFVQYIERVIAQRGKHQWKKIYLTAAVCFALLPQVLTSFFLYPHLLSYYSWTIGSIWGARVLRLESTYWAETYRSAIPFLNENAKPNATIWVESPEVFLYYQEIGDLRKDLQIVRNTPWDRFVFPGRKLLILPIEAADYVVIEYRQSGFNRPIRRWIRNREPVYQLGFTHVPLLEIYEQETQ